MKIQFVPMDKGGCGYYRIIYPAQMLYNTHTVTINPVATYSFSNQDYLMTQRVCNKKVFQLLLQLKEQGVKFIVDYDDIIWQELPEYNRCKVHWKDNYEGMKEYLHLLADKVTCSTEYLKKELAEFIDSDKIHVIPNSLDYNRWRFDYYKPNDKLSFFYAGSDTHWSTTNTGDFNSGLINYLKDKELNTMGTPPVFLNCKNNVPWVDINSYPIVFANQALKNKFVLVPLVENNFNKCKSDLKYLECCAIGRVALVGTFPDSPYNIAHPLQRIPMNCSEGTIRDIVKKCEKNYDEIIEYQYKILNSRFLKKELYEPLFD